MEAMDFLMITLFLTGLVFIYTSYLLIRDTQNRPRPYVQYSMPSEEQRLKNKANDVYFKGSSNVPTLLN